MTKELCLYRNSVVSPNRGDAKAALMKALSDAADGEIMINRYKDGKVIKVLIGIHTSSAEADVTKDFILDSDAMPKDVEDRLKEITGGGTVDPSAITALRAELIGSDGDTADKDTIKGAKQSVANEKARATTTENTIEASVGLADDGSHKKTTGNYTSKATTVVGEIAALDTQVKKNADAITTLNGGTDVEGSVAKSVKDAIEALDIAQVGGTGKVITTVSETNGKIAATAIDLKAENVAFTPTAKVTGAVDVTGTTVTAAIASLAKSVKSTQNSAATYKVVKVTEGLATNVKEAYQLVQTINGKDTNIPIQIPIYKDQSLKNVELVEENDKKQKGQFMKYTYINADGGETIAYVDCSKLLAESEFKNGLAVSAAGEVSVKIDATSEGFLSVGEGGVKLAGVQKKIDGAKTELLGDDGDTADKDTIKGAKKYTDSKIADLDKADTAVAKKFVTSVSETDGLITVTRGEITSKDKTIKMTDGTDGGLDVAVNIDGTTIIKNASSGVLSVASGALTQYKGSNAIKVSEVDTDNNKTVSLSINSNDKVLTQNNDGLFANINLTWDKAVGLKLIGKDSTVIATIPATDFIKDGMLEKAAYDDKTHKITLTFNTDAGKTPVELNLSDLVDTYEAGDGLGLTGKVFSVKKSTAKDSEEFLAVGTDGIKVSGIQKAINTAAAKATTKIADKTNGRVRVSSATVTDGSITYTIVEDDIAQATVLESEISRAKAAELKTNQNVGLNNDGSHKKTTGNYTSGATTVVGEIAALDTRVKKNAVAITTINNYTIGGAKISTNPTLTGEKAVSVNGLTISLNVPTDSNLVNDNDGLKLADKIDCGEYE